MYDEKILYYEKYGIDKNIIRVYNFIMLIKNVEQDIIK